MCKFATDKNATIAPKEEFIAAIAAEEFFTNLDIERDLNNEEDFEEEGYDEYDECTEGHDDREGETSGERCEAMEGCVYDEDDDHCEMGSEDDMPQEWMLEGDDECTEGHDDREGETSGERCEAMEGCIYTEENDHCEMGTEEFI